MAPSVRSRARIRTWTARKLAAAEKGVAKAPADAAYRYETGRGVDGAEDLAFAGGL